MNSSHQEDIKFVVGAERKLRDVLSDSEVLPLLQTVVHSGGQRAMVENDCGETLWAWGEKATGSEELLAAPLVLEGEPVGRVVLWMEPAFQQDVAPVMALLHTALQAVVTANLKRMLTTEVHTSVVSQSYEELLETNQRLAASEEKYRELAASLEKKVAQRTNQLKRAHASMLQQEKMAAIGQLAAGMAHEINNPLGFVSSNLSSLRKYLLRLREMLIAFQRVFQSEVSHNNETATLKEQWRRLKLDFVLADSEGLISQSLEGCDRVKKIVADLKAFSHIDDIAAEVIDVNKELDKTLNVLQSQLPTDSRIIKKYGEIPDLACPATKLCQVFLNLFLNAIQARQQGLVLSIATSFEKERILIRIVDNGPGIPENILNRVFEPFFTTKDVGQGTGMGLTVAYDIITSYGGKIEIQSRTGKGTACLISLPAGRST